MANTKDLRAKIDTTKKTQQTTRAMKMVAAAKLRKSQNAIVNARPYAKRINDVIYKIVRLNRVEHPLFKTVEHPKRILMVILTSDRGLCGAFNANIIKFADKYFAENKSKYEQMDFFFVGRRGAEFFKKRNVQPVEVLLNLSKEIRYDLASEIAEKVLNWFSEGNYDEVQLVYNEFKSAISQKVVCERLLPLVKPDDVDDEKRLAPDVIFEPTAEVIVDELVRRHFAIQVYRCLQESVASEHGARMNAMENATKNAGERLHSLTLYLNKIRQSAITTELIEITSGAEALNG